MLINIAIEKTQPLTGTASSDGKAPVPFAGWLELLRAVAELVGTPEQSADDQDTPPQSLPSRGGAGGPRGIQGPRGRCDYPGPPW
jgi:hypothetical protein